MKHFLFILGAAAASLCLTHVASAQSGSGVTVSLALASGNPATATAGGMLTYNINVSGLKGNVNTGGPAVGGFDLALNYNPALLTPTAVTYGTLLGPNDFQFSDLSTSGQAFMSDSASASASTLISQQPAAFTLGTITFQVVQAATSAISFDSSSSMSNENGGTLNVVNYGGTTVPEPSTYAVALLGTVGMCWHTLRRRAKAA